MMQRLLLRSFGNTLFILYFMLRFGGTHQIINQRNESLSSPRININLLTASGNTSYSDGKGYKTQAENISTLGMSLIEQMNTIVRETSNISETDASSDWSSNFASDAIRNITENPTSEKLSESLPHLVGYVNTLNKYMSKISALRKQNERNNASFRINNVENSNESLSTSNSEEPPISEFKIDREGKIQYIRAGGFSAVTSNLSLTKERPSSFLGRTKIDPPPRQTVPDPEVRSYRKHAIFCLIIMSILSLGVFAWLKIGIEGKKEKKSSLFKRDGPRRRNKQPLNFGKVE
jgi:hypothetical protein